MTKREAAIIMAYTDTCMLTGEDLKYYYEYVSEILGYEVQTFDLTRTDLIREKSKGDFIKLCEEAKKSGWVGTEKSGLDEYTETPIEACPDCIEYGLKVYPECVCVGDQKDLWVAKCPKCGFTPAYYDEAQPTQRRALKLWNKKILEPDIRAEVEKLRSEKSWRDYPEPFH